jgi:hypothetical protein
MRGKMRNFTQQLDFQLLLKNKKSCQTWASFLHGNVLMGLGFVASLKGMWVPFPTLTVTP